MSMLQRVTSSRQSIKDFSRFVAAHQGIEWSDAYYQRIRDLLKGERDNITEDEEQAFEDWGKVLDDPFGYAVAHFRLQRLEKDINTLDRYLKTGNYRYRDAKKKIDMIRDIIDN